MAVDGCRSLRDRGCRQIIWRQGRAALVTASIPTVYRFPSVCHASNFEGAWSRRLQPPCVRAQQVKTELKTVSLLHYYIWKNPQNYNFYHKLQTLGCDSAAKNDKQSKHGKYVHTATPIRPRLITLPQGGDWDPHCALQQAPLAADAQTSA